MKTYQVYVENIKCGGCAHSITSKIAEIDGVDAVDVVVEEGQVTIQGNEGSKAEVTAALKAMGYPEVDSVAGMENLKAKATSFVSCAVGRIQKGS